MSYAVSHGSDARRSTLPPVGVVAGDGVDHRLGVGFSAPDDLVGVAKPAQILQHENEVVGRRIEGGVERTCRLQRIVEADLLVEADFPQVEIGGLAQLRSWRGCPGSGA